MYWLANKTCVDRHVLAMLLSRESMKNVSPTLKKISDVMELEIPRTDEPIKTDKPVPEPVQEEKPTLIDDMSEPLAEINEPEIWLGGRKYTKEDILKMTAESVEDHRKIVELTDELDKVNDELVGYKEDYKELSDQHEMMEVHHNELVDKYQALQYNYHEKETQHQVALAEIEKLNKELQELTEKYMAKDKECMKYGIMVNDLHAEIDELKDGAMNLEQLTLAQAIQHYRALNRLFTDEVLQ
jgi:chromosome segregation ATPase